MTNCAAMLAWSSPGSSSVAWPRIRAWRAIRSSTVVRCAWPMWSEPVTFGGGWMIVNGGRAGSAVEPRPSGAKTSAASQRS